VQNELRAIVESSRRIVFFGGAGVSTESGIPDFRSSSGLYAQTSGTRSAPEEILSHSFFVREPELFFGFYRSSMLYPDARPNRAHLGLAALEASGRLTAVVTQNIDGLHQAAGSRRVLELHGSVHRNTCQGCGRRFALEAITSTSGVPRCDCSGIIKPDVVLYEEALDRRVLAEASEEISRADTLIVGGTSLAVYPAAGLLRFFEGGRLVIINADATDFDPAATLVMRGPIAAALGQFAD